MFQIPCPYCGVRDSEEFIFGGPIRAPRPADDVSDAMWADYLFNCENPKGVHLERWYHAFGCGCWLEVTRDTVTHEILSAAGICEKSLRNRGKDPGAEGRQSSTPLSSIFGPSLG